MQLAQAAKALHHVGAHRTNEQPVHVEQPGYAGVEEEIDGLSFGDRLLGGELDRINTVAAGRAAVQERVRSRAMDLAPTIQELQAAGCPLRAQTRCAGTHY